MTHDPRKNAHPVSESETGCVFMKKLLLVFFFALCLSMSAGAAEPAGYIALTFDDGPSGPITEKLLDGLLERDAHATFFLCGYRMREYPGPLGRYLPEGHELGVHSTRHLTLTKLSAPEIRRDLEETSEMIREATGVRPTLMRPPGGGVNSSVLSVCRELSLTPVLWSVDPRDWCRKEPEPVLAAMAREAGDGDIILMHDMSMSSVEAALRLVDDLGGRGFRFVTVSELASLRGRDLSPGSLVSNIP